MENERRANRNDKGSGGREDGGTKQFTRVSMSNDRKWIFVDTVTCNFVHVNYMDASRKGNASAEAEAGAPAPAQHAPRVEGDKASAVDAKGKRARKADDRAT